MVRKQIYISAEQNTRLRRAAVRSRRTEAEVLREALDDHLGDPARKKVGVARDALWGIVGIGASREGDLSERVDDYLYGRRRR
jgi:hypothetical protein